MPYKLRKKIGPSACTFIEEVIDGMPDWVRVIDKHDNIIFVNKSMRDSIGMDIVGQKCYEVLGRTAPCYNCISRSNLPNRSRRKEEVINGHTFSVTSSPFKGVDSISEDAVIEVLHDITELKKMSQKIKSQNEKLKEDLSMAKRLQLSLLPQNTIDFDNVHFNYIYRPCETLGGDFLDIFRIDDKHLGLYIADVSGHGVAASMLTMFLNTALDRSQLSPSKALERLYASYNSNKFFSELYIAIFYIVINTEKNTITYSNAGLNVCPVIFRKSDFQILRASGIPISNWVENPDYCEHTVKLEPNDSIFLYTDGIIEIRDAYNHQFGEERLVNHIMDSELPPAQKLAKLIDSAVSFSNSSNPNDIKDDITVALVEIN
ncbi:sigma-B regulation protein RsbU (phosphoserine phosphatase) [Ruminiclostridium sufflavum DSM 19573]|uniref:Sigma-B regulation protein RsbU (Phosphoserine phosphatase) n=1 Tax=Ruminiclostridium sufflavum DSM 19573 TaxID=1121337 RepID=A0A318Y5D8_9FIRM|nr:SpoIIE family protein phosphatase [Ruminiclostridium sufflavum]PYG87201.1 sigma-B regulation protein RsbU (phosphoserine phosphatase) [Ruminiclostridium sufflavum DSM 19573]